MASTTVDDILAGGGILDDPNFKRLAAQKTSLEEFHELIKENAAGYSQKKRLSDGLKDLLKKVEEAENRLIVAQNLGKSKGSRPEDKELTSAYDSHDLKEKSKQLLDMLGVMLDEGQISQLEKSSVIENLRQRIQKAKDAGKDKLQEKLDKWLTQVCKVGNSKTATVFAPPVANIKEFVALERELRAVDKLDKLIAKSKTAAILERIENKKKVNAEYEALRSTSKMWFESDNEFKARLEEGIVEYEANEKEMLRREEEEAFEKKKRETEEALAQKRAEEERKELEKALAVEQKLKAKREEAAKKPAKVVEPVLKKEKKAVAKVDLREIHHEDVEYEALSPEEIQADIEAQLHPGAGEQRPPKAAAKQAAAAAEPEPKALSAEEIAQLAEEKQRAEEEKFKAIDEKLAAKRAGAEAKPKKEAPPPPKKKEKKAPVKLCALDFYDEDTLLEKLAAQEKAEKAEKAAAEAAAKKAEEEAAARAEREEAEAYAAWEAAQTEAEKNKIQETLDRLTKAKAELAAEAPAKQPEAPKAPAQPQAPSVSLKQQQAPPPEAPSAGSAPAKPKPAPRKPPPVLENKWGAPAPAPAPEGGGGEGEGGAAEPGPAESMPSLLDALTGPKPKKQPPVTAGKPAKKKWGKVDASVLGFDADNPNYS